jgi:hypothetical protein
MPITKPDYQCVRCGYSTPRRDLIKKHFYKTVKPCLSCLNNIELTEEIKNSILLNRIYFIENKEPSANKSPKFQLERTFKRQVTNDIGAVYLIWTREFYRNQEMVLKVGRSQNPDQRICSYGKGTKVFLVHFVSDPNHVENLLKKSFTEKFKLRSDIGLEYFEGPRDDMAQCFCSITLPFLQ